MVYALHETLFAMGLLGYTRVIPGHDVSPELYALMCAGVEPHDVFSDGISPVEESSDLAEWRRLLEHAEEGDTIVVWRIDRLGRSLSEVLETVTLLRQRGITLRSMDDGIDPDTTHGRVMLELLASLAEYERHLTGERIEAGKAPARRSGKRRGRPPVDADEVHKKLRVVEDGRARGLTAAEAAQLVGWSRATYYRHQRQVGTQP